MNWTANDSFSTPKPRRTLLPTLVFLFVVSYGLLAMLVVEQGRTIDNQRGLIQALFSDSKELTHLRDKLFKKNTGAQAQAPAQDRSQAQSPSAEVSPRGNAKHSHKADKLRKPPRPQDDGEILDARRTTRTI